MGLGGNNTAWYSFGAYAGLDQAGFVGGIIGAIIIGSAIEAVKIHALPFFSTFLTSIVDRLKNRL